MFELVGEATRGRGLRRSGRNAEQHTQRDYNDTHTAPKIFCREIFSTLTRADRLRDGGACDVAVEAVWSKPQAADFKRTNANSAAFRRAIKKARLSAGPFGFVSGTGVTSCRPYHPCRRPASPAWPARLSVLRRPWLRWSPAGPRPRPRLGARDAPPWPDR